MALNAYGKITNNIFYIALMLLCICSYIFVFLYNKKWNHYQLNLDKDLAEKLLKDCTNFKEEDFVKFTETMTREEQILWLKSLTWIDEDVSKELHEDGTKTTIITEKIVPLIEEDEDLQDFECFLKKL